MSCRADFNTEYKVTMDDGEHIPRIFEIYDAAVRRSDEQAQRSLTVSQELKMEDAWSKVKRWLSITGTSTRTIPRIDNIEFEPEALALLNFYSTRLLVEIQKSRTTQMALGECKASQLSDEINSTTINNKYILIYRLLQRIVGAALSDTFLRERATSHDSSEDKLMQVLDYFIKNLAEESKALFYDTHIFGSDRMASLGTFLWLDGSPHAALVECIKQVIRYNKFIEAPGICIKNAKDLLEEAKITFKGYLLVFLSEVYRLSFSNHYLNSDTMLAPRALDHNIEDLVKIFTAKLQRSEPRVVADSKMSTEIKAYEMTLSESQRIVSETQRLVPDSKLAENKRRLRQKFLTGFENLRLVSNKLLLIDKTVDKYYTVVTATGWTPIIVGCVSMNALCSALLKLPTICQSIIKSIYELANDVDIDPIIVCGLNRLPKLRWDKLASVASQLSSLEYDSNRIKISKILTHNIKQIEGLGEELKASGLLDNDVQLVSGSSAQSSSQPHSSSSAVISSALSSVSSISSPLPALSAPAPAAVSSMSLCSGIASLGQSHGISFFASASSLSTASRLPAPEAKEAKEAVTRPSDQASAVAASVQSSGGSTVSAGIEPPVTSKQIIDLIGNYLKSI